MFDFDKDYLYHSVEANVVPLLNKLKLEDVLKSGYIFSRRNIFKEDCTKIRCGFNSNDYISLAKKISNEPDLNKLINTNITNLTNYELLKIICTINELKKHQEAYYQYSTRLPTFIFNTNIGEIKTTLINDRHWIKYINEDEHQRYSDLIGEYQIKNSIDINSAVAIALPYEINLFRIKLLNKLHASLDYPDRTNELKNLTLERINLIEKYLPNTPIVDISSQKILTKSMFNDII